jgi:hypothetical protein
VVQTGSAASPAPYPVLVKGLLSNGQNGKARSWPLAFSQYPGEEKVDVYIHFPIRLHRRMLSYFRTGKTLPFVIFEGFTAVTMKIDIFWNKRTQFVPQRKYVSATEPSRLMLCVRFEVFTAVTMKNAVF